MTSVDVRIILASTVEVTKDEILITFAVILDVVSCKDDIVFAKIVDAFTVEQLILLAVILDTEILLDGTNWPFVEVTNTKLVLTGISSSCNKYVELVELFE